MEKVFTILKTFAKNVKSFHFTLLKYLLTDHQACL